MDRLCALCDEPAAKQCAGCGKVCYCSRSCQETHWVEHLFQCKKEEDITTADHLALAVYKNLLPTDLETSRDYGFTRAFTAENQANLLGLYIGLIERMGIKARTIHRWRLNGRLVPEIKARFESLPAGSRGGYYPWFLQNQWIFDGRAEPETNTADDFITKGWIYSGGDPSASASDIQSQTRAWPPDKVLCLKLCTPLLSSFHPSPSEETWIPFGFCTCNENSENALGAIYQGLLTKCTFQELHGAFISSQLIALFHKNGFGQKLLSFPFLIDVLNESPNFLPVWSLKQFIVNEAEGTTIDMPLLIRNDYGFANCRNPEEEKELIAAYRTFFAVYDANPPALHRACLGGKTFDYISGIFKLKNPKRMKRLLKNSYRSNEP